MTVEVIHNRDICIGCGACVAVCPKYWDMNADGKSDLKNAKRQQNGETLDKLKILQEDGNLDAAKSCPVNCIHVTIKGEQII